MASSSVLVCGDGHLPLIGARAAQKNEIRNSELARAIWRPLEQYNNFREEIRERAAPARNPDRCRAGYQPPRGPPCPPSEGVDVAATQLPRRAARLAAAHDWKKPELKSAKSSPTAAPWGSGKSTSTGDSLTGIGHAVLVMPLGRCGSTNERHSLVGDDVAYRSVPHSRRYDVVHAIGATQAARITVSWTRIVTCAHSSILRMTEHDLVTMSAAGSMHSS